MFNLHVVLPNGTYLNQDIEAITLPTVDGQRTLLANHMATVLPIETGLMYIKIKGERFTSLSSKHWDGFPII